MSKLPNFSSSDRDLLAKQARKHFKEDIRRIEKAFPYVLPKNYLSWQYLSALVAMNLLETPNSISSNITLGLSSYTTALWAVQRAPLYCCSPEMLQILQETEMPNSDCFEGFQPPLPTFGVLFPQKTIPAPHGWFDYLFVHCVDRDNLALSRGKGFGIEIDIDPMYGKGGNECKWLVHATGVDTQQNVWYFGLGYDNGQFILDGGYYNTFDERDREFTQQMRSLVLQILLVLAYCPDLSEVEAATPTGKSRKGFGRKSENIFPRWLGKNLRSGRSASDSTGTGAKKRIHWRRFHWRNQPYGKGRKKRRPRLIHPILVNGDRQE